jgi:hypothetical protein
MRKLERRCIIGATHTANSASSTSKTHRRQAEPNKGSSPTLCDQLFSKLRLAIRTNKYFKKATQLVTTQVFLRVTSTIKGFSLATTTKVKAKSSSEARQLETAFSTREEALMATMPRSRARGASTR